LIDYWLVGLLIFDPPLCVNRFCSSFLFRFTKFSSIFIVIKLIINNLNVRLQFKRMVVVMGNTKIPAAKEPRQTHEEKPTSTGCDYSNAITTFVK
jgi:hypothetical protein